jgi:hypothetical protein
MMYSVEMIRGQMGARSAMTCSPNLFQTLRSTRETELAEIYPLHVVCARIGSKFRVIRNGAVLPESTRIDSQAENDESHKSVPYNEKRSRAETRDRSRWAILDSNSGTEEVDTATGYVDSVEGESANGAKTGAVGARGLDADRQLAWLNDVWSSLPEGTRGMVLEIAREATRAEVTAEPAVDRTGAGPF